MNNVAVVNFNIDDMENLTSEQLEQIQSKAMSTRLKKLEKDYIKLNDRLIKQEKWAEGADISINKCLENDVELTKKIVKIENNYIDLTKTFLLNSKIKREFDKYINNLTYQYTGGSNTICDELFHRYITKACKGHVVSSLDVTNVNFINIDDFETTKTLSKAFMKPYTVKNIILKELGRLREKNDSKVGLKPDIKAKFEVYLEETNGGNNINVAV